MLKNHVIEDRVEGVATTSKVENKAIELLQKYVPPEKINNSSVNKVSKLLKENDYKAIVNYFQALNIPVHYETHIDRSSTYTTHITNTINVSINNSFNGNRYNSHNDSFNTTNNTKNTYYNSFGNFIMGFGCLILTFLVLCIASPQPNVKK